MKANRKFRRLVASLLVVTTANTAVWPHAHGAPVSTELAVVPDRERILVLLDRPDVAAQLQARGVSAEDAKGRVAALTDAEVARLAAGIDRAPAGGFVQALVGGLVIVGYVIVYGIVLVGMGVVAVVRAIAGSSPTQYATAEPGTQSGATATVASESFPVAGDTWTYRLTDLRNGARQTLHQVTVESASADLIRERSGQVPHRNGGYLMSEGGVVLFSPYLAAFDASLAKLPGATIENLDPSSCAPQWLCSMSARVAGKELVRVPAGEFEATRVEVQQAWSARAPNAAKPYGSRTLTVWYSPLAKRAVKFSSRGTEGHITTDFELELESYTFKGTK